MTGRLSLSLVVATALQLAAFSAHAATPNVVSTSPVSHAFAPRSTAISITFDQALLPASVTSSSLRVFGRATGRKTGTISFSNADQTVTFTPSIPFSAGETVWVNLSHDVQGADSTPLRSAGYALDFIAASNPATAQFGQIDEFSNRTGGAQTRIYGAVASDFNGDGYIDLGTVNEVSADLRVFLNRADGSGLFDDFLPPYDIGLEASPNEPGDFDNDGKIDIVVSATDGGGVWIARGNGDGSFASPQIVLTGSAPHGVVVLDVDGDGDMDIVEAIYGDDRMALMLNDGNGMFGSPSYFDGACGDVMGLGSGEWGLASGDMNGDGITDLVVGCVSDSKVDVLLGNGDGTFTALPAKAAGGQPWQVAIGDLDGDGDLDVTLANDGAGNGGLLLNNGSGVLGTVTTFSASAHTPATDLADLDGDGDLDWILSSFGAGLWRIYMNDGNANFTFGQDIDATDSPSCAVILDIDNDGDLDLALSDELADTVKIMQNGNPPSSLCPPAPASCRTPFVAGKSSLLLKDKTPDKSDQLVWKWLKGPTTPLADYGDPVTTDDYALCVYDNGALVTSADAPHGGLCRGKPCWAAKPPTKITYKNRDASTSGTIGILLKAGLVDGKALISFKAKGGKVNMPDLSALTGPVVVQLQRSGGAPCFGATYSAPFKAHDATILKDKAD